MSVIEENQVCQINDINFTVGASAIEVQQENLAYKFHALRHRSSSKIPTGTGGNIVNITIQIPDEDILKLHRLIIQARRNSYIYIENKLLRHKLAPHWPSTQNMAFSLLGLNVESVVGNVGLFSLSLQLSWFNYLPFTPNFLFRQEWETDWMKVDENSPDLDLVSEENVRYYSKSIFGYITRTWSQNTLPPTGWAGTLEERMKDWSGFINDLLPVPSGMRKAQAVQNPRDSHIYVRYYNQLQYEALRDNFYIDLKEDAYLGQQVFYNGLLSGMSTPDRVDMNGDSWSKMGDNQGHVTLPEYLNHVKLSGKIIEKMLSFDYFNLGFKAYRFVTLPPSLTNALNGGTNKLIEEKIGHDETIAASEIAQTQIPQEIKDHILEWEELLNCNPTFREQAILVLMKMINGETVSGIKYTNQRLKIAETIRPMNASYGAATSLHKIRTPDGKPDAFAMDLNLSDAGRVGNHLDKVSNIAELTTEMKKAIEVQMFHFDYGYIVNTSFSSKLIWGGNFDNGYDKNSIQKIPIRTSNAVYLAGFTGQQIITYRNENNLGPPPSDYYNKVYRGKNPGTDHVHIQYRIAGSTSSVYNRLQSGWRPSLSNGDPVYNQDMGSYVNAAGEVKPWYAVFDDAMVSSLKEDDSGFIKEIENLRKSGWKYYARDRSVNGIFYKDIQVTIPSTSGNIQLGDQIFDGGEVELDTILHKVSGSINHIVVSLPVIGHEYPVHQHLGSTDASYSFEFLTTDKIGRQDGLGKRAQLLEAARSTLQSNGRSIRTIYDSWMADADNFITRLFGSFYWLSAYPSDDPQYLRANKDTVAKAKKVIISNTQTATVPGSPGLSSFALQCEETQPFVNEELTKTRQVSAKDYEVIYRKVVKKVLEVSLISGKSQVASLINEMKAESAAPFYTDVLGLADLSTAPQKWANDYKTDAMQKRYSSVGLTNLKLNNSSVSGLTEEEQKQLESFIMVIGMLVSLTQSIMFEKPYGGKTLVNGSSLDYDLYGLQQLISPRGKVFLDYSFAEWGSLSKTVLTHIYRVLATEAGIVANFGAGIALGSEGATSFAQSAGFDNAFMDTNTAIAGGILGFLFSLIMTPTAAAASYSFADKTDDAIWRETIIVNYLGEIVELSAGHDLIFTSATSDYVAGLLDTFLAPETSPLNTEEEVYSLASSARNYLIFAENKQPIGILTEEKFETNKAELIKRTLATTIKTIFNNPFLLRFFDIEKDVGNLYNATVMDERDALPDLNLPVHPYWNKSYQTPPDFYYFNYHEDGQYSTPEYLERMYTKPMKTYVDNISDFMTSIKEGTLQTGLISGNVSASEVHGSYDFSENEADPDLLELMSSEKGLQSKIKTMGYTSPNPETGEPDTLTFNQGKNSCNFLASNFDRDATYTPRTTAAMAKKIAGIEAHFGKKEGYANEREEIATIIPGRNISLSEESRAPSSFAHFSSKEDLFPIAQESMADLLSQTHTMKRAWPTYRLYIIEEDDTEDFIVRYDDFYNYNAIREITIVRSREVSGDVAVVSLQNVSGVLDGSRRLSIKDTDFLTDQRKPDGTLTSTGKKIEESRSSANQDTSAEENFTSVILRPGVNIQLRTGYGNNPNNLEVKLSGRITDVSFSENSDIVEVTIQGFGVELEQQQKGMESDSSESYNLTHKLLGSLMFSPELQHFGRFEKGIQYQFGESKDAALDFRDYNTDPYMRKFRKLYFANTSTQINDLWGHAYGDHSLLSAPYHGLMAAANANETVGAFGWDIYTSGLRNLYQKIVVQGAELIENSVKEKISYALTSPQDDNLFPPNPKDYLVRPNWLWSIAKDFSTTTWENQTGFSFTGLQASLPRLARNLINAIASPKLDSEQLDYVPTGSTIFQIFHEMTLRHPGYVYSAMPYGKEFRYTMFFGTPAQRYWSKPAHPAFISRTNALRKAQASPMNDKLNIPENKTLERVHTITELRTWLTSAFESQEVEAQKMAKGIAKELIKKDKNSLGDKEELRKLNVTSLAEAQLQYYQALTLRFEPFRRYHMSTSETDILSNNISASDYNVANAVAVKYYTTKDISGQREQEDIALVKMHESIPDSEIKLKPVDFPNINGEGLALRYGVGELVYQAKQMYQGSLLLLGNSRIKPWDIIFILDRYNDMAGPIEVEQIVEKFSFETGYVVDIKPNAVVFANEVSSFPIMEGLKAVVGELTKEQDKFYTNFKGNDFFNYLLTNSLTDTAITSMDDIIYNGGLLEGRSLQDISEYMQGGISKKIGLPSITQPSSEGTDNNVLPVSNLTPLQTVFTSGAWLLGGMIYTLKALPGQNIIVYPLLKNGVPFVAGIPSGSPDTLWSIFRGQVSSFFQDVTKGTVDYLAYWKLLGTEGVQAFTVDGKRNEMTMKATDRVGR